MGSSLKRFLQYLNESDYRKTLLKRAESSASALEQEAKDRILNIIPPATEDDMAIVVPGVLLQSEIDQDGYPTGEIITKINDPGVISYADKVQKNMDDLLGATERKKREDEFLKNINKKKSFNNDTL
jgi:hypothetical protein